MPVPVPVGSGRPPGNSVPVEGHATEIANGLSEWPLTCMGLSGSEPDRPASWACLDQEANKNRTVITDQIEISKSKVNENDRN